MAIEKTLEKQRKAIEKRSKELFERLRGRRAGLHVEQAADLVDNQQLAAGRDFEVGHLNQEFEELSRVQVAMDRLEGGSYGICADCETEIPKRRLEVMPWAIRCVKCQEAHERSSGQSHATAGPWQMEMA